MSDSSVVPARRSESSVDKPLGRIAWPVRTERLSIRPATDADLDALWDYRRLPEMAQWVVAWPTSREEHAERMTAERLESSLVIELDGAVVGDLMMQVKDAWAQAEVADLARGVEAEIGWSVAPAHQHHGYASEAVAALLGICFDRLGLRRVTAACFADNTHSWRLMERLGMRREEHTVKDSLHRSGEWLDGYRYALLADEWRARGTR